MAGVIDVSAVTATVPMVLVTVVACVRQGRLVHGMLVSIARSVMGHVLRIVTHRGFLLLLLGSEASIVIIVNILDISKRDHGRDRSAYLDQGNQHTIALVGAFGRMQAPPNGGVPLSSFGPQMPGRLLLDLFEA